MEIQKTKKFQFFGATNYIMTMIFKYNSIKNNIHLRIINRVRQVINNRNLKLVLAILIINRTHLEASQVGLTTINTYAIRSK